MVLVRGSAGRRLAGRAGGRHQQPGPADPLPGADGPDAGRSAGPDHPDGAAGRRAPHDDGGRSGGVRGSGSGRWWSPSIERFRATGRRGAIGVVGGRAARARPDLEAAGVSPHNPIMEIHKKFSIPVACFVFALLGLALGASNRKDGKLASFVLGIGVIFVYYVVMFTAQAMTKGTCCRRGSRCGCPTSSSGWPACAAGLAGAIGDQPIRVALPRGAAGLLTRRAAHPGQAVRAPRPPRQARAAPRPGGRRHPRPQFDLPARACSTPTSRASTCGSWR